MNNVLLVPVFLSILAGSCAQTGRVLHISDLHYDSEYDSHGDPHVGCHRSSDESRKQNVGTFGNYSCDSPTALLESALSAARKFLPNPDLILWTGDSIPHGRYAEQGVIDILNTTTSFIRRNFPSTLVLPVFGNHDYAPDASFPDATSRIYEKTYELWKDWIGDQAKETFIRGGYYKFQYKDALLIILNTVLYYRDNNVAFADPHDPAGQFAFIESLLEEAHLKRQVVHVIAHIAPGMYQRFGWHWIRPHYNKKLLNLTITYADTIKWMIFGHHHSDTFHLVKDPSNNAVQLMLMGPAVSPVNITFPGAGPVNPAFRVVHYDPNTWSIVDIDTYYVDLRLLNTDATTTWALEYSMKEAYDLPTIDAKSMGQLVERLKTDKALFAKYIGYNSVQWSLEVPIGHRRTVACHTGTIQDSRLLEAVIRIGPS